MYDYQQFYQNLSHPFRRLTHGEALVNILNILLTLLYYAVYPILLVMAWWQIHSWWVVLMLLAVPGGSFLIVSAFRRWFNRQRPYEKWGINPLLKDIESGKSFPSKHVFSATIISVSVWFLFPVPGYILIGCALLLAIMRVIGGVHYPGDVLMGYLIGLLFGSLYFILL
ncbi:phosphatase PAP2 family protein [Aerococcus suis]|uniref:PAP2 superfamily protein n=1 Tax=Aerococcus suis TaxID=371602 RepID=A0A1W1ZGL1_9LACT|nr:phosphatase PAP2 family protein [Aerococcus suis]MDY4647274.1 phosphatase PAP2 family protein [Aerococcus suis]SMC47168.1 PAP2 superfamily protein [Aerococcus suis]